MRAFRWIGAPALLALVLAGCTRGPSEEAHAPEPVTVETPQGSDIPVISLTAPAAARLDVQMTRVVRAGGLDVVPAGAVLYDAEGKEFVYTSPKALTFVRHAVRVDRFEGDIAVLADGPPAGTNVVTVGAAELYGAEHGLGTGEEEEE